jgi:hypothetical protein
MRQSRAMSLAEATTILVAGFVLALVTQILLFRFMGLEVTLIENIGITVLFSVLSIARSYVVRRVFNLIGARQPASEQRP